MEGQKVLTTEQLGQVTDLQPESSGEIKLTPDTTVLCINRGRRQLRDTFDSRHYVIPVGYFTIPYGAALHFKNRQVVPGSRNPETNYQASFISIIGVASPHAKGLHIAKPIDDEVEWPAFSDEECDQFGEAKEAIDREGLGEGAVEIRSVRGGGNAGVIPGSRIKGGGGSGTGRGRKTEIVGEGKGKLKKGAQDQLGARGENEATRQMAADKRDKASEKD